MLDKFKKKKEGEEKEPRKIFGYELSEKAIKLIAIIAAYVFMLIVIFTGNSDSTPKEKIFTVDSDQMTKLFDKIDGNYTVNIKKLINEEKSIVSISIDDKTGIKFYSNENIDCFIYKDKYYSLNSLKEIKLLDSKPDFIDDNFSNVEYVKRIFNHCEYEGASETRAICHVSLNDCIFEYNDLFGTNYELEMDKPLDFNVVYFKSEISSVTIDYTDINKIINNTEDEINYELSFSEIGKNDFDFITNKFEDILK